MCSYFKVGKNISLRELRTEDASESYYNWMNDPEMNQFLESRFYPNSMDKIKSFISSVNESSNSVFFAIIDNQSQEHIGNIKLGSINWIHRVGDIGLIIDRKKWGQGVATEAIELVVNYAFSDLGLHKVIAGAYSDNVGSIHAFEKNKFVIEGVRKAHAFYKGKYTDVVLLGRINESC